MPKQYKYRNPDYLGTKIKQALNKVGRGSMSREEASAIIVECGEKLAQVESNDIPLPMGLREMIE